MSTFPRLRRAAASATTIVFFAALAAAAGCRGEKRGAPPGRGPAAAKAPPPLRALRLVTWNVLADAEHAALRTPALLRELEASRADVIALQEVAPWFLAALSDAPWVKGRYHLPTEGGEGIAPGGQLILSRYPIARSSWEVLPGRQRRTALYVELAVNGRRLVVGTSHLESFLPDGPVRAAQLRRMFSALSGAEDAVLLGDLNFGDGEQPDTAALDPGYRDLWTVLRPGQAGHTWDMARVDLARVGAFRGEGSRRLDRILVRSPCWRPRAVRLLGEKAVGEARFTGHPPGYEGLFGDGGLRPGDRLRVHPSDHLGLAGELAWAGPARAALPPPR